MPDWQHRSKAVIHAAGMISVQAGCTLEEAVALIERRAELLDTSRESIAAAVVDRAKRFDE